MDLETALLPNMPIFHNLTNQNIDLLNINEAINSKF